MSVLNKEASGEELIEAMLYYKEQLYRIAYSYLKNEHDALEAIQEVSCRAYAGYGRLKNPEYFHTWLIRIMINYCIDELKRKKRQTDNIQNEFTDEVNIDENSLYISSLLEGLEPKYRKVILLKYFEDLTLEQISRVLEKPVGTVKTWLYKAHQKLKDLLEKEGGL